MAESLRIVSALIVLTSVDKFVSNLPDAASKQTSERESVLFESRDTRPVESRIDA